jgi:nicotinate-nucleotide adenylyltransferase
MARLGIFGGTFDPPHLGHLILAAEAFHHLKLDRLLWVLTPEPPHKSTADITPYHDRLDMLMATIDGDSHFELSRIDIDRPGPHFAVDTLRILQHQKPGEEWIYIMGGDSLRDLYTWRNPVELVRIASALGVMVRPGIDIDLVSLEEQVPGVSAKVSYIQAPLVGISASDIRHRAANGLPFRYLVPYPVYRIIQERGLYQQP